MVGTFEPPDGSTVIPTDCLGCILPSSTRTVLPDAAASNVPAGFAPDASMYHSSYVRPSARAGRFLTTTAARSSWSDHISVASPPPATGEAWCCRSGAANSSVKLAAWLSPGAKPTPVAVPAKNNPAAAATATRMLAGRVNHRERAAELAGLPDAAWRMRRA